MRIIIQREDLLEPLQLISGVVEKRQTLPILSSILMIAQPEQLSLVGTNLEVELIGRIPMNGNNVLTTGEIAVPAHKLMDICRLLPDKAILELSHTNSQVIINSGRSRFVLSTFSSREFPSVEQESNFTEFAIPQNKLKHLIEKISFAMGEQDVRYFLNGLQVQIDTAGIDAVAADGHRLAFGFLSTPIEINASHAIIPRKGILELLRLLQDNEEKIIFGLSDHHIRVVTKNYTFTSKLIDSGVVNYHELMPENCDKSFQIRRDELKQAVTRIAVLLNEKIRAIRFQIGDNMLKILASNIIHEHAEEEINIDYKNTNIDIAFNANYLLDVLSAIRTEFVELCFASAGQPFLVKDPEKSAYTYVLMPIL